jgi:hypothetical protein
MMGLSKLINGDKQMKTIKINRTEYKIRQYEEDGIRWLYRWGGCAMTAAFEQGSGRNKRNDFAVSLNDGSPRPGDLAFRAWQDLAADGVYGKAAQKLALDHPRAKYIVLLTPRGRVAARKLGAAA